MIYAYKVITNCAHVFTSRKKSLFIFPVPPPSPPLLLPPPLPPSTALTFDAKASWLFCSIGHFMTRSSVFLEKISNKFKSLKSWFFRSTIFFDFRWSTRFMFAAFFKMRLRIFIRGYVRPSVGPSVGPSHTSWNHHLKVPLLTKVRVWIRKVWLSELL